MCMSWRRPGLAGLPWSLSPLGSPQACTYQVANKQYLNEFVQSSSINEMKVYLAPFSVFLSSGDVYVGELLELHQGCQEPLRG